MEKFVRVWQLGRINYGTSLNIQQRVADLHKLKSDANTLLLIEHPPVYTIGIRDKNYTLDDEQRLKKTGAEYYKTNRGGLITFHGPGQLVVYPILNLKQFQASMRWYVNQIEETIIDLCYELNLKAERSPHTGVWIRDNKICAIGVHGSRFITTHGLALNCNIDLNWFKHIIPCGIVDKGVTSLSLELNKEVTVEEIIPIFLSSFSKVFNCMYTNVPSSEVDDILIKTQSF